MEAAPLYTDLAEGPDGGVANWLTTSDGTKIRVAHWAGGTKGTVLIFPGRTEYIEKYGRAAGEFLNRGYGALVIDWRGQGLADRLSEDGMVGHVRKFSDYQLDVAAVVEFATAQNLPKPWFLMAHSMGGCIGLRALQDGLDVKAAAFSAPMWGIKMEWYLRPFAWVLSTLAPLFGKSENYAPGTKPESYVLTAPFADNCLTGDEDMWKYMKSHVTEVERFGLGGPSLRWLFGALVETKRLRMMAPPSTPCVTFLGTDETVVPKGAIHKIMSRWKIGDLHIVDKARHEFPMETVAIRKQFFDEADALFSKRS